VNFAKELSKACCADKERCMQWCNQRG